MEMKTISVLPVQCWIKCTEFHSISTCCTDHVTYWCKLPYSFFFFNFQLNIKTVHSHDQINLKWELNVVSDDKTNFKIKNRVQIYGQIIFDRFRVNIVHSRKTWAKMNTNLFVHQHLHFSLCIHLDNSCVHSPL